MHSRAFALGLFFAASAALAEPVPLAGNAYLTSSTPGSPDGVGRQGLRWQDAGSVFSVFFHVDRACSLDLSLKLRVPQGRSTFRADVAGKSFPISASGTDPHLAPIGRVEVPTAGYLRVDLKGLSKEGDVFADVSSLEVLSSSPDLKTSFVRNNEGNMFYWGRRGPSVHLGYRMPKDVEIEYAYSELTVPPGEDPPGSYFMANGFGEGYFGFQVKSPTERWVLFSVWSPHPTDRPSEIPEDKRVALLRKGEGVRGGEFGGEGSGGQSILVHPWKSGTRYKFLTAVQPDGKGSTVYTAWFGEAASPEWRLMASFKRPQTHTHLTGFHSFLENFYDANGHLARRSLHSNPWVRDTQGTWHKITTARFTGDGTASGGHRLDYAGGLAENGFFMHNGGFFNDRVKLNTLFTRPATPDACPVIDFKKLESSSPSQTEHH